MSVDKMSRRKNVRQKNVRKKRPCALINGTGRFFNGHCFNRAKIIFHVLFKPLTR